MTIQRTDLKIFKPQLLGNAPFAGGHRTTNAVESGKLNDVLSSISDVDHARSSFDLVKLYPAVNTADASLLQDAHVYIGDQPDDPLVSTLLVESSSLKETSLLSDMKNMLPLSATKYHGLSLSTAESTSSEIKVANTTAQLLPKSQQVKAKFAVNAFKHNSGTIENIFTRKAYFKAPDTANAAFFSVEVADLFSDKPDYEIYYLSVHGGWDILKPLESSSDAAQVNYANGVFDFALNDPLRAGNTCEIRYKSNKDYRYHAYALTPTLVLEPGESISPGTMKVKKAGTSEIYTDNGQGIFSDNTGNIFAQVDYATAVITPLANVDLTSTINDDLGAVIKKENSENLAYKTQVDFSLGVTAFIMTSLYIKITLSNDSVFSLSPDINGNLTHASCTGTALTSGYVSLAFLGGIEVKSVDYDIEELHDIVIPADWLGIDPSSLPNNGVVNILHENNLVSIQNRQRTEQATLTNAQKVTVLSGAKFVDIMDSNNVSLYSVTDDNYSYDKTTGEITIKSGVSGFSAPFVITAIQSELALVAQINENTLSLLSALSRTYPAGATVSSVYVLGDFQALTKDNRTLSAWGNNFSATGDAASANINTTQYPIEMNNIGAINQKWALVFTSNTAFYVLGEHIGQVANGDITADLLVINPFTGSPYFIIRKSAFGVGLNNGESFLFETLAASKPIMVTRSVSPGHTNIEFDSTSLGFFGNKD
jgi:hypothetical protein